MSTRRERLEKVTEEISKLMKEYNVSIEILQEDDDSFMTLALVDKDDEDYEEPLILDSGYKCVMFNEHNILNDK